MKDLYSYYVGGKEFFTASRWTALIRDERTVPVHYKIELPKTKSNGRS